MKECNHNYHNTKWAGVDENIRIKDDNRFKAECWAKFYQMIRDGQKYGLSYLNQFKYQAELHKRLKAELDKRDFTGLPTDKLYYIINHVQENLNDTIDYVINPEDSDIDYLDDYFEEESEI